MKKTLIALVALACAAFAETDPVWTVTSTAPTTTTTNCNPYGLVFDLKSGDGYRKTVSGPEGYEGAEILTLRTITLGTTATSVNCNFVLLGNLTAASDAATKTGDLLGFISKNDVALADGAAVLDFTEQNITLKQSASYRLFFTTTDYSTTTVGSQITLSGNTTFNMTGLEVANTGSQRVHLGFLGSGSGPGLNQAWTPVAKMTLVPEPATATMSLLALAGMAVRRRRK